MNTVVNAVGTTATAVAVPFTWVAGKCGGEKAEAIAKKNLQLLKGFAVKTGESALREAGQVKDVVTLPSRAIATGVLKGLGDEKGAKECWDDTTEIWNEHVASLRGVVTAPIAFGAAGLAALDGNEEARRELLDVANNEWVNCRKSIVVNGASATFGGGVTGVTGVWNPPKYTVERHSTTTKMYHLTTAECGQKIWESKRLLHSPHGEAGAGVYGCPVAEDTYDKAVNTGKWKWLDQKGNEVDDTTFRGEKLKRKIDRGEIRSDTPLCHVVYEVKLGRCCVIKCHDLTTWIFGNSAAQPGLLGALNGGNLWGEKFDSMKIVGSSVTSFGSDIVEYCIFLPYCIPKEVLPA